MFAFTRKKGPLRIEEIWFPSKIGVESKSDIAYYMRTFDEHPNVVKRYDTLITDLTLNEYQLFNKIDKNYRYEIRRAKKTDIKVDYQFDNISREQIEMFVKNYNLFQKEKKYTLINESKMVEYLTKFAINNNLMISQALIQNSAIVWHVYAFDQKDCRLMFSVSHYRTIADISSSTVGMANRMLHFDDMLFFKKIGICTYDWGGISDEPELKNITDFKMKFGGEKRVVYNVLHANTFLGKIALIIKNFIKKNQ